MVALARLILTFFISNEPFLTVGLLILPDYAAVSLGTHHMPSPTIGFPGEAITIDGYGATRYRLSLDADEYEGFLLHRRWRSGGHDAWLFAGTCRCRSRRA